MDVIIHADPGVGGDATANATAEVLRQRGADVTILKRAVPKGYGICAGMGEQTADVSENTGLEETKFHMSGSGSSQTIEYACLSAELGFGL